VDDEDPESSRSQKDELKTDGSGSKSFGTVEQTREPATIADIKATGNLIYKHIVCMIDFLILKYRELKNPQKDPVVFKKFIFFKQDVITQTAQLVTQLEEFQDIQLWLVAQDFIFTTYELHQYLIQLVIDNKKLSSETTIELQRALTILYKQSILFIRALDHVEAQSFLLQQGGPEGMLDPSMQDPTLNQ